MHLLVRDRGIGFDVKTSRNSYGIGLMSMDERVKLVGGDLLIESLPQRGTTVHARVPLDAPAASLSEANG
jgi:two-component system NarL family sensor kinase